MTDKGNDKSDFKFFLLNDEITFSKDIISIQKLFLFPDKLRDSLYKSNKYIIESNVKKENLKQYIDFLIDESKLPTITIENCNDFILLKNEFNHSPNFLLNPDVQEKILISSLTKINSEKDSSNNERILAQNLDFYLINYAEDMKQISIQSLYNIFYNKDRILKDEKKAYQFIHGMIQENPNFSILLNSLYYNNVDRESLLESFSESNNNFGFNINVDESFFEKYQDDEELLELLYVGNTKNRLNELVNPNDDEKIRWPMELIQNAKDSLYSNHTLQKYDKIQIDFIVKKDNNSNLYKEVSFMHNGPPFTKESYVGLVYKISQGKDNKKSTGNFGTGFLTTHVLSKTVDIIGDRIEKDNKIKGFFITLHREGRTKKDIINDFRQMRKDLVLKDKLNNITKFIYPIRTELSSEYTLLGLNYLKKHISNILIHCPDIEYISLTENETEAKYSASITEKVNNSIFRYKIICNNNIKQFIVIKDDFQISAENNISISVEISVEIDDNYKIIPKDIESESIYTVFPLTGSKKHLLPFALNSPDFKPTTERNALILHGNEEENGLKTDVWINRNIFMKAVDLYARLITYLNKTHCSNMYELSIGLLLAERPYISFDLAWYNSYFLKEMKEVLINNVTVQTSSGDNCLLKNAYFPSKEISDDNIQAFIQLSLTKKYYSNIICLSDYLMWKNRIWDTLNFVSIYDIIKMMEKDQSIFDDQLYSINEFISFIFNYDKNILYKYRLIPDMNNKFKSIENNGKRMNKSNSVSNDMIQLLESINIEWKSNHVNNMITSINLKEDNTNDAENQINDKIKEDNSLCFELMKYILENNERRRIMFDLVSELGLITFSNPTVVKNINENVWNMADKYVLDHIVSIISEYDENNVKMRMDFIKKFISIYISLYKNDKAKIRSIKIIPNANYKLCKLEDLANKSDIFHDHLNSIMINFNEDFNNKIIHPEINQIIKSKNNESITDFLNIINKGIGALNEEKQIQIAEIVVSIVPENDESISLYKEQNEIFRIYKQLMKPNMSKIQIDINMYNKSHWKISNNTILSKICETIKETKSLIEFQKKYSLNENDAFEILNFVYEIDFNYDNYEIIPNKNGDFCLKKNIKRDPGIDDDLLELITILNPESNLKQTIVHMKAHIRDLENFNILSLFQNLIQKISDVLNSPEDSINQKRIKKFFNNVDILSDNMSDDQKQKMDLLKNTHITFIYQRILELLDPKPWDFQRWPFELIQNAVDCIQKGNKDTFYSEKNGSIIFEFDDDKVIFTHFGSPFTKENFISILYQYGGGKEGNKSLIGRFGTGFLSTMILSKKVLVSGDVISYEKGQEIINGCEAKIDRTGTNPNKLNEGIENMENTLKKNEPPKKETKFTFYLTPDNDAEKKASKEGIKSLKKNIPAVLIFNPSITKITVKEKNETYEYYKNCDNGQIQTVTEKSSNKEIIRSFIYYNMNEKFEYDSNNTATDVKIECLLEFESNKSIIYNTESIFLAFPLYGNTQFKCPFIINSLEFEPEKERNDISIQSDEKIKDHYRSSINKFIISKCAIAFEQIMNIIENQKCTNLYNLCSGLKFNSENKFIQENYITKMRNTLLQFPIFETSSGFQKYDSILIPYIEKYDDFYEVDKKNEENTNEDKKKTEEEKRIYDEFYNLISAIDIIPSFIDSNLSNKGYLVKKEHCLKWKVLLWDNFPSKINIGKFIEFITRENDISRLPYIGTKTKELFLKDVINFLLKNKNFSFFMHQYNILLNQNGKFVSARYIYRFNLPQDFIDIMDIVKYDYKNDILHPEIDYLYQNKKIDFIEFDIKKAIQSIKDKINESNYILIMKYVIENDQNREKMFEYTNKFLKNDIEKCYFPSEEIQLYINDLEEMFNRADKHIIQLLIQEVKKIDVKQNINFLYEFIGFLKNNKNFPSSEFDKIQLFPNKAYELCYAKNLKKDLIKDDNIKNVLSNALNIPDLNKTLIADSFLDWISCDATNLQIISPMIQDKMNNQGIKNDKLNFYSIILQNSLNCKFLKEVIDLTNYFFNTKIQNRNNTESLSFSLSLTSTVMKMIIIDINQLISGFSNINEFKLNNKESIFKKLPILYGISGEYNHYGKIFPNNSGELMYLKDIKIQYDSNPEVSNDLLTKLIEFLIQLSRSKAIKEKILNKSIELNKEIVEILKEKSEDSIFNLNKLVIEIMKYNPSFDFYSSSSTFNGSGDGISNFTFNGSGDGISNFNAREFVKFINQQPNIIKVAFADFIEKISFNLPTEIVDGLDFIKHDLDMIKYLKGSTQKVSNDLLEHYSLVAFIYENLISMKKYSYINWPALSNYQTNIFVKYNGKTYYINNNNNCYDIVAHDLDQNKYYFVIKSSKNGLGLTEQQLSFAFGLNDKNDHFILGLADSSDFSKILWITKANLIH